MSWVNKPFLTIPTTEDFILGALANKKSLEESSFYTAGIEALDILITLERIVKESRLTSKQNLVLELYYYDQLTQEEVSKVMGISQQAVLDHLEKIKKKLNKVLLKWRTKDEKQFNS